MRNLFSSLVNDEAAWTCEPDEDDLLLFLYNIEPRMLAEHHIQNLSQPF